MSLARCQSKKKERKQPTPNNVNREIESFLEANSNVILQSAIIFLSSLPPVKEIRFVLPVFILRLFDKKHDGQQSCGERLEIQRPDSSRSEVNVSTHSSAGLMFRYHAAQNRH